MEGGVLQWWAKQQERRIIESRNRGCGSFDGGRTFRSLAKWAGDVAELKYAVWFPKPGWKGVEILGT